jgi:hypothetical protein
MNKSFLLGAAAAVGAVMLIPGVAQGLARAGRPLARAAAKTGAIAADEFRKAGAEAYEAFEDLAAEIREEMEAERQAETEDADTDDLRDAQAAGRA